MLEKIYVTDKPKKEAFVRYWRLVQYVCGNEFKCGEKKEKENWKKIDYRERTANRNKCLTICNGS